jgi:7-keto-8-aminopelargonate synthetase-like enzyme
MTTHSRKGFAPAHTVMSADESVAAAVQAGLIMQAVDDVEYDGRHVQIHGKKLLNFGCCSYLALEHRAELKEGAVRAVERFGTQFSFSRAYLELPLYAQLENTLATMTGGHVLVAPTTTLAHIAALPVLVEEGDTVVVDQFAHASLHTATALLRSIPVHPLRHSRIDLLEEKIARLSKTHRRVWLVMDGLYSMLGDFAPLDEIAPLLEKYPALHLYVDDAHSTSWYGKNGRGYALDRLPDRSRVVVALGFAKAFAVGGAALVFGADADRLRVRRCGGPMLFSGPLQPPLLGACLASAELHMKPEFAALQQALADRIARVIGLAKELDVPLANTDPTPIFFIRCGATNSTFALAQALRDRGMYVSISVFPAVPQNQSGIRFTLSLHNTTADIDSLMEALSTETKRLGIALAVEAPAKRTHSGVMRVGDANRHQPSSAPPPSSR